MPLVPIAKDLASSTWEATKASPGQIGLSGVLILGALGFSAVAQAQGVGDVPPEFMTPDLLLYFAGIQALGLLANAITTWAKARAANAELDKQRVAALEIEVRDLREQKAALETKVEVHAAIEAIKREVSS